MERERRFVPVDAGEVRAKKGEDGRVGITGTAIVFDQITVLSNQFQEVIRAEAVDGLMDNDVRGLFNHDANYVLGRNGRTMSLTKTDTAVEYDIPALPKARADVAEAIERGDVTGNSFSFTLPSDGSGERWTRADQRKDGGVLPLREIVRIAQLYDVGPVTFPAYEGTQVSTRAASIAEEQTKVPEEPPVDHWREREKLRLALQ